MISANFCGRKAALMATTAFGLALAASSAYAQSTASTVQLGTVRVEGEGAPDANPYADPAAPYKADHLSSGKFTEPVLDTPRSVTIITKEQLDDTHETSLRDLARSSAGVTLGTGEGGNAFGDRFFIRGFDVRNDVFVDGVRDPGVLVRENFNTEQVELLKGPASSFAGRGTAGGAINVVTKKARPGTFYDAEASGGFDDDSKRFTFDVNQELTDDLDIRVNGMIQEAGIAGRNFATDDRKGIAGAVTWRPIENLTIEANYSYTDLYGRPDFGVPYNPFARRPVTSGDVPRDTYYGAVNRDFNKSVQSAAGLDITYVVNDWLTVENGLRQSHSLLNYIGTIPENPSATGATAPFSSSATKFSGFTQLNAQSRYEPVTVLVDQPQATFFFDTGAIKHTAVVGGEFSSEHLSFVGYTGLTSELTTGTSAFTSTGAPIVPVGAPTNTILSVNTPALGTNPQRYRVNTNAGFIMDTANYKDTFILSAGIRFDDYSITSANNTASQKADSGITSYNVGLVIKPVENVSLYAAFASAAEPVGAELDGSASAYGALSPTQPTGQIFGPQKTKGYEAGVKWSLFDDHLLATAAFFDTNVSNARETAPNGITLSGITAGVIYPRAAYRVDGVEFGLAGNITENLSVQADWVMMDPKVTASIVPTNIGLELANIAPRSFNVLAKYSVFDWLAVGTQATYKSQVKGGSLLAANGGVAYPAAPYPTLLPSYWRVDAFVEGKVTDNILLRLNVQNLGNTTYYDSLYQSAVPFVGIAPGRAVTVSAEVKF